MNLPKANFKFKFTPSPKNYFYLVLFGAFVFLGLRLVFRGSDRPAEAPVTKEEVLSECLKFSQNIFPSQSVRQLSVNLGVKMIEQKNYGLARKVLQEVLAVEPSNVSILNNLAYISGELGEWGAAFNYLKTAIQVDENCSECHNNLGTVYYKEGRFEEAEKEYHLAAKLNPKYVDPRISLAVLAEGKGEWQTAMDWYKEASKLTPDLELLKSVQQRQVWMAEIVGANRNVAGETK